MTVLVNVSAKQLLKEVNYINPNKSFTTKEAVKLPSVTEMNFLINRIQKEVINKKEGKKFIKLALKTIAISVSILALVNPIFPLAAETLTVNTTPNPAISTNDIIQLVKWILGICLALSFGAAMVTSVLASSLGYFQRGDKGIKWLTEIVKSFVLTMAAPTIIITIALIAYLLFGQSEWFIKPW